MKQLPVFAGLLALATARHPPLQVLSIDHKEDRSIFVRTTRLLRPRLPGLQMRWGRDGSIGKPFGTDRGIPVMGTLHRDRMAARGHWGYSENRLDSLLAEINAFIAAPSSLLGSAASAAASKTVDPVNGSSRHWPSRFAKHTRKSNLVGAQPDA